MYEAWEALSIPGCKTIEEKVEQNNSPLLKTAWNMYF